MRSPTNIDVSRYEALVRKTAARIVNFVEDDYDDICQRLRMKAWRAMLAFNAKRDRNCVGLDRFVFACLQNEVKDLRKKVKRNEIFIEDLAPPGDMEGNSGDEFVAGSGKLTRQHFEYLYLQLGHDQAFHSVEEEMPLIPSTLNRLERQIVHLLYLDYDYGEVSTMLGLPRKEVAPAVRGIREKMRDWKPGVGPVEVPADQRVAVAA